MRRRQRPWLLAQHEALTALELVRLLELGTADELRPWLVRLQDWDLVRTRGRTKAMTQPPAPNLQQLQILATATKVRPEIPTTCGN